MASGRAKYTKLEQTILDMTNDGLNPKAIAMATNQSIDIVDKILKDIETKPPKSKEIDGFATVFVPPSYAAPMSVDNETIAAIEYYSIKPLIAKYNHLNNFVVLSSAEYFRGVGKTYSVLQMCIQDFLNTGKQFVFAVQNDVTWLELMANKGYKFWLPHCDWLEAWVQSKGYTYKNLLTVRNGMLYVLDHVCGHIVSLSSVGEIKGNNFDKVGWIVYDEFVALQSYANQEFLTNSQNLLRTVARLRLVKQIYLGNDVNFVNHQLFDKIDLSKVVKGATIVVGDMVIEYLDENAPRWKGIKKAIDSSVVGKSLATFGSTQRQQETWYTNFETMDKYIQKGDNQYDCRDNRQRV